MKRMRMLAACSLLLTAFPALAQPEEAPMIGMMGAEVMGSGPMGNGMMGPGMMMGMGPSMMMGQGDLKAMVEGRLAYVKTALGITEDEATAWKAYEDTARANVQSMQVSHRAMMAVMRSGSAMERMQAHITMMQSRLDALKALQPATEALYKALTPEQQKKADTLLGMGGGMM